MRNKIASFIISIAIVSSLCFPSIVLASSEEHKTPQDFSASLSVIQLSVLNEQNGNSDRWRSIDEDFMGVITDSTWDDINGGSFTMHNFTNYEQTLLADGTVDIIGTVHGTAQITTENGVLNLVTNGKINGNIPFGAMITTKWNSIGGTGAFAETHANGDISGSFSWLSLYQNPPQPPSGEMSLTGKYK